MKQIFIFAVCIILCLTSCHTSTKITVLAEPGTEICLPNTMRLAIANDAGLAKFKLSDDEYHAFLLSHKPNSEHYIPFALNYKSKSYPGPKILKGLGATLSGIGLLSMVTGVVAIAAGGGDIAGLFLAAGGVGAGAGVGMGLPADNRSKQFNHKHQYKYLDRQSTNQDLNITYPQLEPAEVHPVVGVAPVALTDVPSSTSTKKISQQSNKTLKDYGAIVQGVYVGTGELTKDNKIIESYKGIKVVINRVDRETVSVNVVESNGEKFFSSDSNYTITKKDNGLFELALEGISVAKIFIDDDKMLIYTHPRVNIEGDIYTLLINANKTE